MLEKIQCWMDLEERLNAISVRTNELVLLFHEVGNEDDYMLLFRMPKRTQRKFEVKSRYDGKSSGDYIDVYTLWLYSPPLHGYRIHGGIDHPYPPTQFTSTGHMSLSSGVMETDTFILAVGEDAIAGLFEKPDNGVNLRKYYAHVQQVLQELGAK